MVGKAIPHIQRFLLGEREREKESGFEEGPFVLRFGRYPLCYICMDGRWALV